MACCVGIKIIAIIIHHFWTQEFYSSVAVCTLFVNKFELFQLQCASTFSHTPKDHREENGNVCVCFPLNRLYLKDFKGKPWRNNKKSFLFEPIKYIRIQNGYFVNLDWRNWDIGGRKNDQPFQIIIMVYSFFQFSLETVWILEEEWPNSGLALDIYKLSC